MNAGNKHGKVKLVEITFPLFSVNPAFETVAVNEKEMEWMVVFDILVERIDEEWSELQAKVIITLRHKESRKKIAELITVSIYEVLAGQSMEMKCEIVVYTLNQTVAHAQGAWGVKNKNIHIATSIPQALAQREKESKEIKDTVKQRWDRWSQK